MPDTPPRSRGAMRPRFAKNVRPENRGRGECRAPDAPAASCALLVVSMHTSIHSEPSEITRHSRTQWFTAYTVLSPVIGFLATVVCGVTSANLTPASGCQDHTSSPSAASNARQARRRVHRIPPRVRDVASRPSEWDGTATDIQLIWVFGKTEYFFKGGWTDFLGRSPSGKSAEQIS
ncbi:hypothetical protein SAMN05443248_1143 [Bradyrhizobium erythrophlei]|uniref:Uncharacterized protein n=1 Tax=Bradyrhizobium erythrophlei TaxID=1437360 RepID=A0A1M5IWP5_9BRAD|nr:hypothetical protein SAMN05443248_1143 [Bradyrhizobium erythrophlei]